MTNTYLSYVDQRAEDLGIRLTEDQRQELAQTALRYNVRNVPTKEKSGVTDVYRLAGDDDLKCNIIVGMTFGKAPKAEDVVRMGQFVKERGNKERVATCYLDGSTTPNRTLGVLPSDDNGSFTTRNQAAHGIWRNYDKSRRVTRKIWKATASCIAAIQSTPAAYNKGVARLIQLLEAAA